MDVSKHVEKAEEAVRRKNFDYAISLYQQLLAIRPDEGRARAGLRQALNRRFEYKKSPKVLALLSGAFPLLLGNLYRALKKPIPAASNFERYLVLDPKNMKVNAKLGDCLTAAGFDQSALAVYENLAEIAPQDVEALKSAGLLCYRAREMDKALEYYERALKISPRDQEANKMRKNLAAEGALEKGGFETAKSSLELVKDKDQARKLETEGRIFQSEEDVSQALDALETELAANPTDAKLLMKRSDLLKKSERFEEAVASCEKALELAPSADLRDKLGDLRLALLDRRIEDAREAGMVTELPRLKREKLEFEVEDLARRSQENPTDLAMRFRLGRAYFNSDRLDEAVGEFQAAVKDPRRKLDAYLMLGKCFYKKDLFDLAAKQLERALSEAGTTSPRAKEIQYNLGLIAEKRNDASTALDWFSRVYEVDINYRDVTTKIEALKAD